MSDTHDPFGFGKFVPGFDFLQNLARQPGTGPSGMPHVPGMPSWIAPTLDVGEIDKRIEELRAVQFWLDQNATALKATLQALEVQKMTLATLRGMNVSMEEMAEALRAKPAEHPFADMKRPVAPEPAPQADANSDPEPDPQAAPEPTKPAAPGMVDPMQWWGALSEQFQQIAGSAMQDVARKAGATGPFSQAFASAPGAPATATPPAAKVAAKKKRAAAAPPAKRKTAAARKPAAKAPPRPSGKSPR